MPFTFIPEVSPPGSLPRATYSTSDSCQRGAKLKSKTKVNEMSELENPPQVKLPG